jgi:hypothetical protein
MTDDAPDEVVISGLGPDPHALEALTLELKRLARRYGAEITDLRIEPAPDEES